jgi:hypothetical protein
MGQEYHIPRFKADRVAWLVKQYRDLPNKNTKQYYNRMNMDQLYAICKSRISDLIKRDREYIVRLEQYEAEQYIDEDSFVESMKPNA